MDLLPGQQLPVQRRDVTHHLAGTEFFDAIQAGLAQPILAASSEASSSSSSAVAKAWGSPLSV